MNGGQHKSLTGDLTPIMDLMRNYHLEKIILGDLTIEMNYSGFRDVGIVQSSDDLLPPQGLIKNPLDNMLTEDEVLFWSSGGAEFKDTNGKDMPVPLTGEEQDE